MGKNKDRLVKVGEMGMYSCPCGFVSENTDRRQQKIVMRLHNRVCAEAQNTHVITDEAYKHNGVVADGGKSGVHKVMIDAINEHKVLESK